LTKRTSKPFCLCTAGMDLREVHTNE